MKKYLLAVQLDESAPSEGEIQEQLARTAKVTAGWIWSPVILGQGVRLFPDAGPDVALVGGALGA